ncbi:MAG: OmpA family protein [Gemmatimonadales bacterium]
MSSRFTTSLAVFGAIVFAAFSTCDLSAQNAVAHSGAYDFVPGERVLYAEDFQAVLGATSVMRRLTEATARLAIEPREGRPFLFARPPASYVAVLKDTLPERFTIDFDMYIPGAQVLRISAPGSSRQTVIDVGPHFATVSAGGQPAVSAGVDRMIADFDDTRTMHYSIAIDRSGARIYVGSVRVLDAPGATFGKATRLKFDFVGRADSAVIDQNIPIWISGVRIAAGRAPAYEELAAKGRVAIRGILFNVGSDLIRPESAPSLKLIGDMISSHPSLKLAIEVHTDNFGSSSDNQVISDRRAQAVKEYLTSNFGIDGSRLSTVAMGGTRPVASNSTPEGREQNRRIELVKK